jgi:dienelactone hydrolase
VEVLYPADATRLPEDPAPYRYTPEEVWGELLAALPAGVVQAVEVPDVWFDIPAGTGPFPLVVFSHGWSLMRFSYTYHAAHLASWGYVVALPEHPTRDLHAQLTGTDSTESDVRTILDTVALVEAESSRAGSVLEGSVTGDQVAVEGHSAGGRDAALAAYDSTVDAWVGAAPVVPIRDDATGGRDPAELDLTAYLGSTAPPDKPSMIVVADGDIVIPRGEPRTVYDWLPPPKRYVVLADTGHTIFINDCRGIQERGGAAIADALGLEPSSPERRLLENGCLPDDAPVEDVWATWDHLTVAHLNLVFGIEPDTAAASLERSYLDEAFPGRIAEYLVGTAD